MLSLAEFLESLRNEGRVRVGLDVPAFDLEAEAVLRAWDGSVRDEWPGEAPTLDLAAAAWGTRQLYEACRFLVFRDLPAEKIAQTFSDQGSLTLSASTLYSVDLAFRFLPSLHTMARAAAANDPLVVALGKLGERWPFSSVGMPPSCDIQPAASGDGQLAPSTPTPEDPHRRSEIEIIAGHTGLRTVYVDRIIDRGDVSRLADPRIREAVAAALGDCRGLCPRLWDAVRGD